MVSFRTASAAALATWKSTWKRKVLRSDLSVVRTRAGAPAAEDGGVGQSAGAWAAGGFAEGAKKSGQGLGGAWNDGHKCLLLIEF